MKACKKPWTNSTASDEPVNTDMPNSIIEDGAGHVIAVVFGKDGEEAVGRARFIKTACNSHDALLEALKDALLALDHSENCDTGEGTANCKCALAVFIRKQEKIIALAEKGA